MRLTSIARCARATFETGIRLNDGNKFVEDLTPTTIRTQLWKISNNPRSTAARGCFGGKCRRIPPAVVIKKASVVQVAKEGAEAARREKRSESNERGRICWIFWIFLSICFNSSRESSWDGRGFGWLGIGWWGKRCYPRKEGFLAKLNQTYLSSS